jgi:hypothetical protein
MEWVSADQGLDFVRVTTPNADEQKWAILLSEAINSAVDSYLGVVTLDAAASDEIKAAAYRAFGYGWKYREAPFGEAQWLDEQGGAIRLAGDWIDPIKPILNRHRDVSQLIA